MSTNDHNLFFVMESHERQARLYRNRAGQEQWFPLRIIHHTRKWPAQPGQLPIHTITVEDWFLAQNPWPPAQRELL